MIQAVKTPLVKRWLTGIAWEPESNERRPWWAWWCAAKCWEVCPNCLGGTE